MNNSTPTSNSTHDSYSNPAWGTALTKLARADVQQADVAALMAALLGVEWPVNRCASIFELFRSVFESTICSVGVVPGLMDGPGYLKEDGRRGAEQMARIAVVNARVS